MKPESSGLLQIHLAVILFGLAGVLGKLVNQSPLIIVLARTIFAFFSLGIFMAAGRRLKITSDNRTLALQAAVGLLLALHWWTFFKAVQVSTVAVGLLAYCSFPIFTTFMEPVVFKESFRLRDLASSAGVSLGLILIVWPHGWGDRVVLGTAWGVLSGFLFALLSLVNRNLVTRISALKVAFYQNGFAALVLLLPALLGPLPCFSATDLVCLLLLGIVCTALAHGLFIASLKWIRVQLAGVIAALEPVYGILFAVWLAGEVPETSTIVGGILIVGTTMAAMGWRARAKPKV